MENKIIVSLHNGIWFATVVEENGDEFELTRNADKDALLADIKNTTGRDDVEYAN